MNSSVYQNRGALLPLCSPFSTNARWDAVSVCRVVITLVLSVSSLFLQCRVCVSDNKKDATTNTVGHVGGGGAGGGRGLLAAGCLCSVHHMQGELPSGHTGGRSNETREEAGLWLLLNA